MEANKREFFQCFQPIYFTLFCTGVHPFRINAKNNFEQTITTRLLTTLARLVPIILFFTGCALKIKSNRFSQEVETLTPLVKIILSAELLLTFVNYVNIIIAFEVGSSRHMLLYERAFELDKNFSKEFVINFNYHKTAWKNRLYMLIIFGYCSMYYTLYILLTLDAEWKVGFIATGYALFIIGSGGCSYYHISFMDFLRVRFRLLRTMLGKSLGAESKADKARRREIFALKKHYEKYHLLIQEVNAAFNQIAIIIYLHDFVHISCALFAFCHEAAMSEMVFMEYILLFMYVLPRLFKVIYTAVYSRSTTKESRACLQLIAKFTDVYPDQEVQDTVDAFLLWKTYNPPHFRIGQSIELNLIQAYSFFNGIVNYIFILIQLQSQQFAIEEYVKHKMNQEAQLKALERA